MKRIIFSFAVLIAVFGILQPAGAQANQVPAADVLRQEGVASYYSSDLDGRMTASGEIYNPTLFTAAHPTLPFGTFLLITNRHNNRQVAVKVNDRGPFVPSRIVDVSRAAAEQLDMLLTGTAPVLLEVIQTDYPDAPAAPAPTYSQAPAYAPPPAAPQPYAQPQANPAYPQQAPAAPPAQAYAPQPNPYAPPPVPAAVPPETAQSPYGPVTTPPPQAPAPQATQPQPEAAVENFQLSAQAARLIPAISPQAGKTYKFQVGSYKVARNAVDTYVKLREAGLTPDYERNGEFFRVVLYGVQWNEVQATAEKLGETGFKEALIREE